MENIKIVEIKLTNSDSQEDNILSIEKIFIFKIAQFKNCKTIEEIRDQFEDEYAGSFAYDYLEVATYKNLESRALGKQVEYIGQ